MGLLETLGKKAPGEGVGTYRPPPSCRWAQTTPARRVFRRARCTAPALDGGEPRTGARSMLQRSTELVCGLQRRESVQQSQYRQGDVSGLDPKTQGTGGGLGGLGGV